MISVKKDFALHILFLSGGNILYDVAIFWPAHWFARFRFTQESRINRTQMCEVIAQIHRGLLLLHLTTPCYVLRLMVRGWRKGMALHVGVGPTHLGTWIPKPDSWIVPPRNLTWLAGKSTIWRCIYFLLKMVIFQCHVSFQRGNFAMVQKK